MIIGSRPVWRTGAPSGVQGSSPCSSAIFETRMISYIYIGDGKVKMLWWDRMRLWWRVLTKTATKIETDAYNTHCKKKQPSCDMEEIRKQGL